MRLIIAATALCLSVTSALSYGALFVGKSGDQIVMGLTVGFPTQQEAFDEARRQCEANSKSLSEPCTLSHIVTNSCVAVSGSQLSGEETSNKIWVRQRATYHNYFSIGMGTDHSQAKYDAEAFCKVTNPNPDCKSYYSACDATPFVPSSLSNSSPWYQSLTQGFLAPVRQAIAEVQAWWSENVTTSALIVFAAFLLLAGGLAYAVFKIRRLHRVLAEINPPEIMNEAEHARKQNITAKSQPIPEPSEAPHPTSEPSEAPQPIPEPSKEPKLDTKAIKEALKSRRQEFEL